MAPISESELILNPDGSIYHLHLLPEDIADTIILVGDPGRVERVSSQFNSVDLQKVNREFVTHTGIYRSKRISVLSTGIGTDNIDIVLNELDALVNVNLQNREVNTISKQLNLVRLGTCGALHADIPVGTQVVSHIAGGFDGLYHFYHDPNEVTVPGLTSAFMSYTGWKPPLAEPYFVKGSENLQSRLSGPHQLAGITLSTPGFYAPQVRSIRLDPNDKLLIEKLGSFSFKNLRITNFEMESSALYALSALLGHEALTICVAVANRVSNRFLENYHPAMDELITMVLDKLVLND